MSERATAHARPARAWYRPMLARSPDEGRRASTPLELLFDLCFVVAVALAGSSLHHAVADGHLGTAVLGYLSVFFAIWWAWMNFTWFASAYDCDDVPYRLATLVQIAGALILAAGVPRAFNGRDFAVITLGYVIMRLAVVGQWLRAGLTDTTRRRTAFRYAIGVTACQAGWVARLALPARWGLVSFGVLVVAELLVPLWAERGAPIAWHPGHIAERYGLFTLIVLGETVAAATTAMQSALDTGHRTADLVTLAASGLVTVFAMWWLYFAEPAEELLTSLRVAFRWGYGHLLIFSAAAAVGAGLQVAVDHDAGNAHVSAAVAAAATAVPVAVYLLTVWALHARPHQHGRLQSLAYPVTAVLVLLAVATPVALPLIAVLLAALVTTSFLVDSGGRGHAAGT
jgi:low temperature requirement protein LtrA